ncbi:MAG TPA: L-threonylcarbamoyladenylate synthase [Gemmatimonadales bacterium]|nr:L-threonylcarbamoyladenylate synthase [Gemmatimonadales bacterium]
MLALRSIADAEAISGQVRAHLARGGLLAYPTETVYGVGSAPEDGPLAALAALKGRPPRKPFLLLVASRAMAEMYGLVFNTAAQAMADEFWPGPLTLALPGGEGKLPDALRGAEGGIAVRHTGHKAMAHLIDRLGHPVTSTSANRPGSPPAPGAEGAEVLFRSAVDDGLLLVLDGGVLGNVPPSTLVDCTTPVSRIIREGAIPRAELRRRIGRLAP